MEEIEIIHEDVKGIDINEVSSIQLKDGTVIIVQGEEDKETGNDKKIKGEFIQEELTENQKENEFEEENYKNQSNQFRARPIIGRKVVPPIPGGYIISSGRPIMKSHILVNQPIIQKRPPKPIVPIGYGTIFRSRPGMPVQRVNAPSKPIRPAVAPMRPGISGNGQIPFSTSIIPVKQISYVNEPFMNSSEGIPSSKYNYGPNSLFNKINKNTGMPLRLRPPIEEQEDEVQEERFTEYDNFENEEEIKENMRENQLREKPFASPKVAIRSASMIMKPEDFIQKQIIGPKIGPIPDVPKYSYNTFQPGVFREKPRRLFRPVPMIYTQFNSTFQPTSYGHHQRGLRYPIFETKKSYGFGKEFINRPISSYYNENGEDYEDYYQLDDEGFENKLCPECEKEL